MKKIMYLTAFLLSTFYLAQNFNIKLGDSFSKWEKDFTLKGISSKSNKYSYVYSKPFTKLVFGHKVSQMIVSTKNNYVVNYYFILEPFAGENIVSKDLVNQFEKQMGIKLKYSDGMYGSTDGKNLVEISIKNSPPIGGKKIVIQTSLVSEL